MFKIGDFSKLTNLTVRALRHYEEVGLLTPAHIDQETNYRYYSAEQLSIVNKIKMLQQIGLPLKLIKEVIDSDDLSTLEYYYKKREEEIKEELESLKTKITLIEAHLSTLEDEKIMQKYNVELKEMPKRNIMSLRRVIPNYSEEGILWNEMYEEVLKQNVTLSNPPLGVTMYHDSGY